MSTSDELERLNKLHNDGALSDDEFAQAKRKLLNSTEETKPTSPAQNRMEDASSRDFSFQMIMVVLVVLLVIFLVVGMGPHWHHWHWFQR